MSSLPAFPSGVAVEPYVFADLSDTGCDPAAKPGTVLFKDFLMRAGGHAWGIERQCAAGKSDHERGRAVDWMIDADNPVDAAIVDDMIGWLLATDENGNEHANARHAGITYIIWNRQVWSTRKKAWVPYPENPNPDASPHTNHVHISLSEDGGAGRTSFYAWLRGEPLPRVGDGGQPPLVEPDWLLALALGAGILAGYLAARSAPWRRFSHA